MTITELIEELSQYEGHLEAVLMLSNDHPQYVTLAVVNEANVIEGSFLSVAVRADVTLDTAQNKADAAFRAELEAI